MTIRIFSRTNPLSYVEWKKEDIWAAAETRPIDTIKIADLIKDTPNVFSAYGRSIVHTERARLAKMDYPIIVACHGDNITVLDGFHRIYKALKLRQTEMAVKILKVAPTPAKCCGRVVAIPGLQYEWIE